MKVDRRFLTVSLIICLLPIVIGVYFYNEIPSQIAVHFGINGEPDKFINKNLGIVMLPCTVAIIQLILSISADLSEKTARKGAILIKSILPIFSVILQSALIIYAVNDGFNISKLVIFIIGILFMVLGNYMPKRDFFKKSNFNLFGLEKGIDERKFVRAYSKFMVLSGVVIFTSAFIPTEISIIVVVIFAITSFIYPFYIARKYGV